MIALHVIRMRNDSEGSFKIKITKPSQLCVEAKEWHPHLFSLPAKDSPDCQNMRDAALCPLQKQVNSLKQATTKQLEASLLSRTYKGFDFIIKMRHVLQKERKAKIKVINFK